MNFKRLLRLLNFYPPYIGAGIRVVERNADLTRFVVEMKLRWYNRNAVGTHFGGSLYAMCDPFYMFIVMGYMGRDFIVWDKSAKIDFKRPGRGTVRAVFTIEPEKLAEMRAEVLEKGKQTFWFQAAVTDEAGEVVAVVDKEVYVRQKR